MRHYKPLIIQMKIYQLLYQNFIQTPHITRTDGLRNIGNLLFNIRKIYEYKKKAYEISLANKNHIKELLLNINPNHSNFDISFNELNEKEFLQNGSFLSNNNDSLLITNELKQSTHDNSMIKIILAIKKKNSNNSSICVASRLNCSRIRSNKIDYNLDTTIDGYNKNIKINSEVNKNRSCCIII